MKKTGRYCNSLLGRVSICLTLVVSFVAILIITLNVWIYRTQKEGAISLVQTTLTNSNDVFSAQLDTMAAFYQSIYVNNVNFQQLRKPVSEKAYHMAATQILKLLDSTYYFAGNLSFVYCYNSPGNLLIQSSVHPNYETSEAIKRYIKEYHRQTEGTAFVETSWHMEKVEDSYYLFYIIRQKNLELGVVLESNNILKNMHLLDEMDEAVLCFSDENDRFITGITKQNGQITACSESDIDRANMLCVSEDTSQVPARIHLLLPRDSFLIPYQRQLIINLSMLLFTLAVLSFLVLYLFYLFTAKPVQSIADVAGRLGQGELDQRIPENENIAEINEMNHNFNQLIASITALKIDLYEEKLRRQEAELARLRLQLNPHFLLNSLNLVYTMTRQKHYEVSMQFCLCLIRHFRFVLRKSHNFVPLSEELDFCENYMEILSLQYPSYFFYEICLADESIQTETLIPPLSIQTIIENSVKYGFTQEKPLHIRIRINRKEKNRLNYCVISVSDDGPGFSEESLKRIRGIQERIETEDTFVGGVGLPNLIERYRILYEGNAKISFENQEGAQTVLEIPSVWPQNTDPE